ncbi:AAA family ATPase [Methylobacterium sp. A52T]
MTNPLYLTRIELAQFRSFAELGIDLPAEPGVLIVHGSNGLGKSSLFDALEWTLTDAIDHFQPATGYDKVGAYLCRWRSEPGPTSSAMRFSDGSLIERRLTSYQAHTSQLAGTVDDVVGFLRSPAWTQPITAINRYLLLTHFLGQSTLSRLTHRKSEERFEILKEAAQSADLEAFGTALHGKGSTLAARAFNKRINELAQAAEELRRQLKQEAELWAAAQASGALDETSALTLARQVVQTLDRTAITAVAVAPAGVDIAALSQATQTAARNIRERSEAIAKARLLLEERSRHDISLAEITAAMGEADREAESARSAAELAQERTIALRAVQEKAFSELSASRASHRRLVDLQQSGQTLDRLRETKRTLLRELAMAEEVVTAVDLAVQRWRRRQQIAAGIDAEIAAIDHEISIERNRLELATRWLERHRRIGDLLAGAASLTTEHPRMDTEVAELEAAAYAKSEAVRIEEDLLTRLRETVGSMTAAVTMIAASLPEGTCDCPVCATSFDDAEALRRRATTAAERLAPMLVRQEQAHREALREQEEAVAHLDAVRSVQAQIQLHSSQLEEERVSNARLAERLGLTGPTEAEVARLWSDAEARIGSGLARARRRRRWRERFLPLSEDVSAAGRSDPTQRRVVAIRQKSGLAKDLDDLERTIAGASVEFLSRVNELFPQGAPSPEQLDQAVAAAAEALSMGQRRHDAAREEADAQAGQAAAVQETRKSVVARLERLAARRSEVEAAISTMPARWTELNWPNGEPNAEGVEGVARTLPSSEGAVAEANALLRQLREGIEAQSRQQSHSDTLERLRLAVDLPSNANRVLIRENAQTRLCEREEQADATRRAKEVAKLASIDIGKEVEGFNAEYIQPLDELMKQVNRAILCDQRVGIDLHVRNRRIEQSASRVTEVPESVGAIDPLLVHSEGQMAALAVGMLSAASLTYPWSRWRALVLDDPLQHNDAIHAAAFADLMANMVQEKGYQVLLSTHDLAQAEFLQRKFDARRIPCAALSLLGRGRDGVEWSYRAAKSQPPAVAA